MSKYMQDMLDRQAFIDQNMQKQSPFDEGVMRAVKSAKQSIGMDEDQSDRAMRNGLMGFSEALNQDQTPTGRGFMGKFAAAARGVPAGMRAYDESEMAARNENSLHADMARRFRAGEDSKGEAGWLKRTVNNNWLAEKGGVSIPLTPEQVEIETLGSLLAGYGNKLMNYTNQIEFASLPHISPYNSDATNLATLKKIQEIIIRDAKEGGYNSGMVNVTPNTTEGLSGYGDDAVSDTVSSTPNNINDSDDFGDL